MSVSLTEPLTWLIASQAAHIADEKHASSGDTVRDIIIGFSDGLTVPFALTAGLSSLGSSKVVIVGGLAELFSGSISMGVGAYLAAVTDRDHYINEEKRERREVAMNPAAERQEIYDIFVDYGVNRAACQAVVDCLCRNEDNWVKVGLRS
jgi:vacuolar iron transporter family protein